MTADGRRQDSVRPHMVMVVGNRVKGDSRVEKAALSAQRAGYRVTVLGLIHRTVPQVDLLGDIPIFRVAPDYAMYTAWRLKHDEELIEAHEAAKTARDRLRDLRAGRGKTTEDVRLTWRRTLLSLRLAASDWMARMPIRGSWRRAWPLIADLELAFAKALVELRPDIIHVHDRDPLPAADTATRMLRRRGHDVKWLYDAHEWLPGVTFTGPKVHRSAWLHAEADLIGRADTVISVSEDRAESLQARHGLREMPTVVTNSPLSEPKPDPGRRGTVRDECGLDPEAPLLVYVGRAEARRGLETVVRALPDIPDAHLAVVAPTDPKPRAELMTLAEELDVSARLHLLDYVPAASVTWYLSTATVGLSPLEHNPAHHQDVATKIREYLHAGIPIVASDARAQARFVNENGIGTVHRAGDPADCARAVNEAIRDREQLRSNITEDLLEENSWERQEQVLIDIWTGLVPAAPDGPADPRPSPRLVVGPTVDPERSSRLMEALSRHGISGQLIGRTSDATQNPGLRAPADASSSLDVRLDEFRLLTGSDGLLLESLGPLCGGILGNGEDQLARLVEWVQVAVMLDPAAAIDPDVAMTQIPDSWLGSLTNAQRTRISRQGQRTRRLIRQFGLDALISSPLPSPELGSSTWLPTVVDVAESVAPLSGPLRVVVDPRCRSGSDAATPGVVEALAGPKLDVSAPESEARLVSALRDADVFVDGLGHGSYTDAGARALGAGCVVISRIAESARQRLPASCPVLSVPPAEVGDVISDLVSDREKCLELKRAGLAYARDVHDGRRSAAIVAETFGWAP